ncbi:MAG: DUF6785 family protein [Armatimonadota bacterium]
MGEKSSFGTVRARAFIIGIVFVVIVCAIVSYSELVASRGGSVDSVLLGASQMPPAAIGMLLALVLGNLIVKKLAPKLKLRQAELAAIYVMISCAAVISSFSLTAQLLPALIGGNYFANGQNNWRQTIFQHLPKWMIPFDPAGPDMQPVAKAYYEGLSYGEKLPWGNWIVPLGVWTIFVLVLFFLMACMATLLRKQWVDNEKLSFPLVQLPLEMTSEGSFLEGKGNKLMWVGALIPFLFHGMNGLHNIAPNLPQIPSAIILNQFVVTKPWTDMIYTPITITFSVLGFAYLLPLDVCFSMWFFPLFFRGQDLIGSFLGYQFDGMALYPTRFYTGYQSVGAAVAVCISIFWYARPHLKLVWERVNGRGAPDIDNNEIMSYRTAMWGALISMILLIAWCNAAGMSLFVSIFVIIVFVLIIVVLMSRCVAEIGLLMAQGAFRPIDVWAIAASRGSLGAANLAPLAIISAAFIRDPRTLMPIFMDGMKLSDGAKLHRSKLGIGLLIAIPVAVLTAYVLHLIISYKYGAISLNTWFYQALPQIHLLEANQILQARKDFDIRGPIWAGIGFVFTSFLYFMRARFWWWPFHPLGYAAGTWWPLTIWWSVFLVGWVIKSRVLKYGGIKFFLLLRPFFLGLIFGEFFTAFLWAMLKAFLGWSPPSIPLT